jgi:ferredoxin-NADP reductase
MTEITNNTRESMSFTTGVKDGAAITESLKPGETRDIKVNVQDAQLRGRALSGAISIKGGIGASVEVQAAGSKSERRTASTLAGDAPVRD